MLQHICKKALQIFTSCANSSTWSYCVELGRNGAWVFKIGDFAS